MIVDSFSDKDMVAAVKPAKLVTLFANPPQQFLDNLSFYLKSCNIRAERYICNGVF